MSALSSPDGASTIPPKEEFGAKITRINNAIKASESSERLDDRIALVIRRLRGARSSADVAPPAESTAEPTDPAAPARKQNSVSHTAFADRLMDLGQLLKFIAEIPAYAPNEADMSLASLEAWRQDLTAKTKSYIRSVYGNASSEAKHLATLNFRAYGSPTAPEQSHSPLLRAFHETPLPFDRPALSRINSQSLCPTVTTVPYDNNATVFLATPPTHSPSLPASEAAPENWHSMPLAEPATHPNRQGVQGGFFSGTAKCHEDIDRDADAIADCH
jgi:hypothetical protein